MTVVYLDCPHGGADPGASGNGLIEKTIALDWALYKYKRFKELGVPVDILRTKDVGMSNEARTKKISDSKAKICLSGHFNGFGDKSANGVETIHSIHNKGVLANRILDALVNVGGIRKRRAFSRANNIGQDYYFMHRLTGNVQTIIVEYGFLSNKSDSDNIKQKGYLYPEAEVKATVEYLNQNGYKFKYSAPKTEKPKTEVKTEVKAEAGKYYRVQLGAFTNKSGAEKLVKQAKAKGLDAIIKYY